MVAAVSRAHQAQPMTALHAHHRDERSAHANHVVGKLIPEYLRGSPRARHGIHKSVVVPDPLPSDSESIDEPQQEWKPIIRVKDTDTLSAARQMTYSSRRTSTTLSREQATRRIPNVCVLNQASALRPGGGFMDGVHSQEEFLCQRSTLYASLWDSLYPLPEHGGIFSSDVLVFGDSTPDAVELAKRDRVFIDVISASMIRFPGAPRWRHDGEEVRHGCSCGVSYCDQDRNVVMSKMTAVLRMAQSQGAEKLVLGAWGCGSYLNPPREVARLWKRVLLGNTKSPVTWPGLKEIVFAITDKPALREFEKIFADEQNSGRAVWGAQPERALKDAELGNEDEVQALISKIQETEIQLAQTKAPRTRGRLRDQLTALNNQLAALGTAGSPDEDEDDEDDEDDEGDEDFVLHGYPASDNEDNSYYNFDENDDASSDSATPASTYEFRFDVQPPPPRSESISSALEDGYVEAFPKSRTASPVRGAGPRHVSSFERDAEERRRLDETGWFAGSVNELSALLRKTGGGQNPALSPADTRTESAAFPEY